jgi:hypothetical protein
VGFAGAPARPSLRAEKRDETRAAEAAARRIADLTRQIRACPDADAVRALWATYAAEWTDELTRVAKDHITQLPTPA